MSPLGVPALVLAADHRARGVVTVEDYDEYLRAARAALTHCDGVLASLQPLVDLVRDGECAGRATYLSLNRTGLAGSAFELDDRLVTTVRRAVAEGCSGVKVMVRLDPADRHTAAGLELVGRVVDEAHQASLETMVEVLPWGAGACRRDTDAVVHAAVVVHDLGAPLLKVPVPDEPAGAARTKAVARVVRSVGAPVLFLGGPRHAGDGDDVLLTLARDVMDGGGAGLVVGRGMLEHPDPGVMAQALAGLVHGR